MADSEWHLTGYQEIGEPFEGGFHNFDPDSPGTRIQVETFDGDWSFLPDADYVVVSIDGDYVALAGPFDDYDDLSAAVDDYEEEGS